MSDHAENRARIRQLSAALFDWTEAGVRAAIDDLIAPDATLRLCHAFGDCKGAEYYDHMLAPLKGAMPDVERRDWIIMAGSDADGARWVGTAGNYIGTFVSPFLDIPPTGHLAHMRFHEYYRFKDGKVVEMQAIWDIPELMMQAEAWPMAPALGRFWATPGPATGDGIRQGPRDEAECAAAQEHVLEMLAYMGKHPDEPPEAMEMPRFWHPRFTWYGPAGIGTTRGISGFRHWHQIPFLGGMPDRGKYRDQMGYHFFADGPYVAVTGWPNMRQTLTHDGFLSIAPAGQEITMRSLDFWRIKDGLIRENWVMLDLLDTYAQLGVDVLARMREFNKARTMGPVSLASEVI